LLFEVGFKNYLTERVINGKIQELMIIKEHFEGPVGDFCIACNTIKCLFVIPLMAGYPSNLAKKFSPTEQFPQHILPFLSLYNAQWWGYELL